LGKSEAVRGFNPAQKCIGRAQILGAESGFRSSRPDIHPSETSLIGFEQ
jgi:hypothetical protein